jgi:hypothetical protein
MSGRHPRHRLDDLLTNGVRLTVLAALNGLARVEAALALTNDTCRRVTISIREGDVATRRTE